MPEIKINKSNVDKQIVYKCFLLNVRSHRDYVCLEVENCPSGLDFPNNDEFSIDSSQIIMPVLDKIRFNIKSSNPSIPFWFENKLEVFAEGHQIFPKIYCSKCESLRREELKEPKHILRTDIKSTLTNQSERINFDNSNLEINCDEKNGIFGTPCSSENDLNQSDLDQDNVEVRNHNSIKSLKDISTDNFLIKELFLKNKFKSRSEMLTVDHDSGIDKLTSFSLPDVLTFKENSEKSVQTRVCLGNRDFSDEMNLSGANLTVTKSWEDFPKSLNSKLRCQRVNVNEDAEFIRSTTERFRSFDMNKKIRYWSLISSARQLMKMNQDVVELNSILKSLAVEKSLEKNNLVGSLSPVNLILKLKKLNRSSSLYNMMNGIPDKKQWYETKNKYSYFSKLTNTFSEDGLRNREIHDMINEKLKKNDLPSNESLLSMDTLFNLQKRMLKMMESFLRRSSMEQNSVINVTCGKQCETTSLENL